MKKDFGKLEKVDLRKYWPHEAHDFTKWLFKDGNLALLGETIGISLEPVEAESNIGSFSADILAKDSDTDEKVIIENQLEKTNHSHLGQLLTYASGSESKTVIWVAKEFRDEHIKTLDWLNNMTPDDVSFFGLEIELWKIGTSEPAPKFNVVCRPNVWTKSFNKSNKGEIKGIKVIYNEFWSELREYFKSKESQLASQKGGAKHWYNIAVGRSNFKIALTLNSVKSQIGCEIYIKAPDSDIGYSLLEEQKESIEKELGIKLNWMPLPKKGASRIVLYEKFDINDKDSWNEGFEWFLNWSTKFHKAFAKRIKELNLRIEEAA